MNIAESGELQSFRQPSGLRLSKVPTPEAMEEALAELRDLEWRAKAAGRSLAASPWAKDGPWHLAQAEVSDHAPGRAEASETLIVNEAGKELLVRKIDSLRPRTPLRAAEVTRYEELLGWIELLADPMDKAVVWAASFHLWRGEPMDWEDCDQCDGEGGWKHPLLLES
jgi:hypothetical protein